MGCFVAIVLVAGIIAGLIFAPGITLLAIGGLAAGAVVLVLALKLTGAALELLAEMVGWVCDGFVLIIHSLFPFIKIRLAREARESERHARAEAEAKRKRIRKNDERWRKRKELDKMFCRLPSETKDEWRERLERAIQRDSRYSDMARIQLDSLQRAERRERETIRRRLEREEQQRLRREREHEQRRRQYYEIFGEEYRDES